MHNLAKAIQWREDVANGAMIEARDYTKTYCGFSSISQIELDAICRAINSYYQEMGSILRIANSMGELVPASYKSAKEWKNDLQMGKKDS